MNRSVEWRELRGRLGESEMYFVVAESTPAGWQFFERSQWEVRWFPLQATPERIARAEKSLPAERDRL